MSFHCQNAAHPAPVLFVCPSSADEGRLRSIAEISEKGSMFFLVGSFELLVPALCPEFILADAESLGGGGSGDRSFPVAPGGGARSMLALGFSVAPPDKPAEESMPLPVDGLFFTFILMVSPSYTAGTPSSKYQELIYNHRGHASGKSISPITMMATPLTKTNY